MKAETISILSKGNRVACIYDDMPAYGVIIDINQENDATVVLDGDEGFIMSNVGVLAHSDKPLPTYPAMTADTAYSCDAAGLPESKDEPFSLTVRYKSKPFIKLSKEDGGETQIFLCDSFQTEDFVCFYKSICEKYKYFADLTDHQYEALITAPHEYKMLLVQDHAIWLGSYSMTGVNPAIFINQFFDEESL